MLEHGLLIDKHLESDGTCYMDAARASMPVESGGMFVLTALVYDFHSTTVIFLINSIHFSYCDLFCPSHIVISSFLPAVTATTTAVTPTDANTIYVELGAGKGLLGLAVNCTNPESTLVLVERGVNRNKVGYGYMV